jgi:GNAT superfamily N-acetyltransferase
VAQAQAGVAAVRPATSDLWPALEALFGRSGASNGCWCMYWILGPEYHRRPRARNRQQLRDTVAVGPSPGLLALDAAGAALGWCRLSPRTSLPWLNRRPDLRPVDNAPVWSLPCFFVRRGQRGRGVMAALVDAAVEQARLAGSPALEAYPVDTSVAGSTRNLFSGAVAVFARAGFVVVARRRPARPIVRYNLAGGDDR